jgi:chorismate lyase/3-hydroxybenzoate synthase
MSAAAARRATAPLLALDPPLPPAWVGEVLGEDAKDGTCVTDDGASLRVSASTAYGFVELTLPDAAALGDDAFRSAARRAYRSLVETVDARGLHLLRLWNYIPEIRRPAPGGSTRYELFNAGRFEGYAERHPERDFGHRFCAATAVGHRGPDLVLHALAGPAPGLPVENPRQRPAYRYSRRYGPVPPCFARAVRIERPLRCADGAHSAILSGTASIVGEDTRHPGDVARQLSETLQNLAHLSRALVGETGAPPDLALDGDAAREALARYTDLRAYVVRGDDAGAVLATLERRLPGLRRLEIAVADLCRPDLRVEIEGLACLDR